MPVPQAPSPPLTQSNPNLSGQQHHGSSEVGTLQCQSPAHRCLSSQGPALNEDNGTATTPGKVTVQPVQTQTEVQTRSCRLNIHVCLKYIYRYYKPVQKNNNNDVCGFAFSSQFTVDHPQQTHAPPPTRNHEWKKRCLRVQRTEEIYKEVSGGGKRRMTVTSSEDIHVLDALEFSFTVMFCFCLLLCVSKHHESCTYTEILCNTICDRMFRT